MSDWKDWEKLLGPGEVQSSGGSSEPDTQNGRKGSVVIRRRIKKEGGGKSIFEIFLDRKPGFAPTSAEIVSLEVEGFIEEGCSERKQCAKHAQIPAGMTLLKPVAGGALAFEPAESDDGILSKLIEQCGCSSEGVKSYKVYVEVKITPEPTPPLNMRFSICYNCEEIDEVNV
jgi:hypothetical protein